MRYNSSSFQVLNRYIRKTKIMYLLLKQISTIILFKNTNRWHDILYTIPSTHHPYIHTTKELELQCRICFREIWYKVLRICSFLLSYHHPFIPLKLPQLHISLMFKIICVICLYTRRMWMLISTKIIWIWKQSVPSLYIYILILFWMANLNTNNSDKYHDDDDISTFLTIEC